MSSTINILHVEDNPGDAQLVADYLDEIQDYHFPVTLAASLSETMRKLDEQAYDIVILDLGLPDSIGMQALEVILKKTNLLPILVITGMEDESLGRNAIKMGAQSYIPKNEINSRFLLQSILYSIERNRHVQKIRQAEEKVKQKNAQLEEANKSKDRLLSIITHDLKSPMSSVVGLLGMLHKEYDDFDEKQKKEYIRICFENTNNTFQLIETMLAWAQSQRNRRSIKKVNYNAFELVDNTLNPIKEVANAKKIALKNNVPESLQFYADADMISTVLRNLVSNAIKFSHKESEIIIGGKQDGSSIIYFVEDKGVGVTQEELEKILNMQEGFTTPGTDNEKGTGFGLILCKEFIEKNGGKMWIESQKGKGTTILFSIPASQ